VEFGGDGAYTGRVALSSTKIILPAAAILVLAAAVVWYGRGMSPSLRVESITVGQDVVDVEIADTESSREQGLSGRTSLAEGQGMLFVFGQRGNWGIWMK